MEQGKLTSAKDYLSKVDETKDVELPSGAVFRIRKINGRDYLREGGVNLQTAQEIVSTDVEKNKTIYAKMSPEEKKLNIDVNDRLLVLATVSPVLSLKQEADKIYIRKLVDKDYADLLAKITEFSQENIDLKFFRPEQEGNKSA